MVSLEVRAAQAERVASPVLTTLWAARAEMRGHAIAARAAADGALARPRRWRPMSGRVSVLYRSATPSRVSFCCSRPRRAERKPRRIIRWGDCKTRPPCPLGNIFPCAGTAPGSQLAPPARRRGCSRKKRSISLEASGPRGSVNEPAGLPPDQACPAPLINHCSTIVRPAASRCIVRRHAGPPVSLTSSVRDGSDESRRLSGHRVTVAWVDRGIAITVENDDRNSGRSCFETRTALLHRRERGRHVARDPTREAGMHANRGIKVRISITHDRRRRAPWLRGPPRKRATDRSRIHS